MKAYLCAAKGWVKNLFHSYLFVGIMMSSCFYIPVILYNDYNHKIKANNAIKNTQIALISQESEFKDRYFKMDLTNQRMDYIIKSQEQVILKARKIIDDLVSQLNKLTMPPYRSEA
jgi:hypothetical protein|tara:strand:- start:6087 stop:6434 length:348 start_codon:yes stop_codon:yes gene_type:complete